MESRSFLAASGLWAPSTDVYKRQVWTRAHFALYLKFHGYVKEMWDAFPRYIGDHAPCYVPREGITPAQAVRLVLEGGGHPVLAHPLLYHFNREKLEQLVSTLAEEGLQGIEEMCIRDRYYCTP